MTAKIAVVDDDCAFTSLITGYLNGRGYQAVGYTSYIKAKKGIDKHYNMVLIDLHLQDGDGFSLLQELCQYFPEQKHIIITGDDSLPKRLQSFTKGADDYMKKPIFPSELEARIHRLLSRKPERGGVHLDNRKYTVTEQKFLELLVKAKGENIPLSVFKENVIDSEIAIYTGLSRLRRKAQGEFKIKSSYGRGWHLEVI